MTNAAPLRAAIYRRISSTSEESASLDTQATNAGAYCIARGWALVETYTDDGISGGKGADARPGLARMMADAQGGRFDVVVVAKLDRLARSLVIWNDTRAELDRSGVAVASVAEGLDLTTPAGRMVANVLASFAEFERERIGERIRDAQAEMAKDGRYYHGPVPFGWTPVPREDGKGLRLALHPEHGPYLRAIVEGILSGRLTAGAAVLRAESEGFEAFPSHTGLRRLLRNRILLGQAVYRGEPVTGEDGLPITPHDALVTSEEFRALDAAMEANRNGTPRLPSSELRLLNALGVIHCGECRRPMTIQRRPDREVYACRRGHVSADAAGLDDAVESWFLDRFGRHEVTRVEAVGDPEAAEKLAAARSRRKDLAGLVAEGKLPAEDAAEHLDRLGATIARLEAETAAGVGERHIPTGQTFAETWEASDIEGRRSLLSESGLFATVARSGRGRRVPMLDRLDFSLAS